MDGRDKGGRQNEEEVGVGVEGDGGGGRVDRGGMMKIKFKPTEKQTQQMRQQQSHE